MTLTQIRSNIIRRRNDGAKWREINLDYPDVKIGTLCRIAHDAAYRPRSRSLRQALGLCGRRRKYDRSTRELREIGLSTLGILYGGKVKMYIVEIVKYDSDEVVKRIECESERRADKVDAGVNINLNHDEYYTRIVAPKSDA